MCRKMGTTAKDEGSVSTLGIGHHRKMVFSSDTGVVPPSQFLDMLEYAWRLVPGLALISTENPDFELAIHFLFLILGDGSGSVDLSGAR